MNFNEMILNLFLALDDAVKEQLYCYKEHNGEYPSQLSLSALQAYQDKGFGDSEALQYIKDKKLDS